MAVDFKAKHTRSAEYRFFPEDIVIKAGLNGRHDLPDVQWLIQDILQRGQVQPVTIRKDGDKAVLVAGFSRWRAISEINKRKLADKKLSLRCTYVLCNEHEGFLANIAENRFRKSTTEIDDAHNIKRLMNVYNMTEEEVANVYFPTIVSEQDKREALKWVRARIALVQLTQEAEQALKEGRLKLPAAKAIAKLSEEQQREAVKGQGKVKAKNIREASGKPKQASLKQLIKNAVETGQCEVEGKVVPIPDGVVEWLGRLVDGKKAKAATA